MSVRSTLKLRPQIEHGDNWICIEPSGSENAEEEGGAGDACWGLGLCIWGLGPAGGWGEKLPSSSPELPEPELGEPVVGLWGEKETVLVAGGGVTPVAEAATALGAAS